MNQIVKIIFTLFVLYCTSVAAQNCSYTCRSACAATTAQNLLVRTYNDLIAAQTPGQLLNIFNEITTGSTYREPGGFYIYLFDWSNNLKAWGAGNPSVVGMELGAIAKAGGTISNLRLGDVLRAASNTTGGSWTKVQWADLGPALSHRSFIRHFNKFLTDYYVGSAYIDVDCSRANQSCVRTCASPCAMEHTRNIVDNLVNDLNNVCNTKELEAILNSVNSGSKYTVQSGFYSFVNLFTGPTVAHGLHPEYVGLTIPEIADTLGFYDAIPMNLHAQFVETALSGGGWLNYRWSDVGPALSDHYAYVSHATALGTSYFVASSFINVPCPTCPCNCDCPTQYCEKCSEAHEEVTSQITFKFKNVACVGDKC